jgi:hypothetical protein
MDYKSSVWAERIISLQNSSGNWGYFHTLSASSKISTITTEQALRRLQILGFTENDKVINKSLKYLHNCLCRKDSIPDRIEKSHNWNIYVDLMLATWIRRFSASFEKANQIADKWGTIFSASFNKNGLSMESFNTEFVSQFSEKPFGPRLSDPITFYTLSIISNTLPEIIEKHIIDYVLHHQTGIYYIYDKCISTLPSIFQSKQTNTFLSAIELLAEQKHVKSNKQLHYIIPWLNKNKSTESTWDLGPSVKDGVHFPLSDSWRHRENRVQDCTNRIMKLLDSI